MACFLLYANLVFTAVLNTGALTTPIGLFIGVGGAVGAYFIANEKKWGYYLAIAASGTRVAFYVLLFLDARGSVSGPSSLMYLITLAFPVVTVVLLLHKMSREHVRIWFR